MIKESFFYTMRRKSKLRTLLSVHFSQLSLRARTYAHIIICRVRHTYMQYSRGESWLVTGWLSPGEIYCRQLAIALRITAQGIRCCGRSHHRGLP